MLRIVAAVAVVFLVAPAIAADRILVRGEEFIGIVLGTNNERSFARGYTLGAFDVSGVCVPEGGNTFELGDQVRADLLAFSQSELKLPAALLIANRYADQWRCPPSEKVGDIHHHVGISDLSGSLRGLESSRMFAQGYIAGVLDGLVMSTGCDIGRSLALDEAVNVIQQELVAILSYADQLPTAERTLPSAVINKSLRKAALCK